jgi:hypothetical protein
MTSFDPLRDEDAAIPPPASVDVELAISRKMLAEYATANIHDHAAMIRVAAGLDHRLRSLIAALDAERGQS